MKIFSLHCNAAGAARHTGRGDLLLATTLRDEPHQLGTGARPRPSPGLHPRRLLPRGADDDDDEDPGGGAARPAVPQGAGLRQRRPFPRIAEVVGLGLQVPATRMTSSPACIVATPCVQCMRAIVLLKCMNK
jgi:hypothetical protein